MQILAGFNVKDEKRLDDLSMILVRVPTAWPPDLLEAATRVLPQVLEILGRERLPYFDFDVRRLLAVMNEQDLARIWRLLLCPWCGEADEHYQYCPLLAPANKADRAMTEWRAGVCDAVQAVTGGEPSLHPMIEGHVSHYLVGWHRGLLFRQPA